MACSIVSKSKSLNRPSAERKIEDGLHYLRGKFEQIRDARAAGTYRPKQYHGYELKALPYSKTWSGDEAIEAMKLAGEKELEALKMQFIRGEITDPDVIRQVQLIIAAEKEKQDLDEIDSSNNSKKKEKKSRTITAHGTASGPTPHGGSSESKSSSPLKPTNTTITAGALDALDSAGTLPRDGTLMAPDQVAQVHTQVSQAGEGFTPWSALAPNAALDSQDTLGRAFPPPSVPQGDNKEMEATLPGRDDIFQQTYPGTYAATGRSLTVNGWLEEDPLDYIGQSPIPSLCCYSLTMTVMMIMIIMMSILTSAISAVPALSIHIFLTFHLLAFLISLYPNWYSRQKSPI